MNKRARGTGRWFLRGRVAWIQYSVRGRQVRESTGIEIDCEADEKKVEKLLRKNIGDVEAGVYRDTRRVIDESLRQSYYVDYENNERKSVRRGKEGKPLLSAVARLDKFFRSAPARESQYDALSLAPPGYLRLPLALGYFTAMRLGGILSLEWSQVDLV